MKKKMFLIVVFVMLLCLIPNVYAEDVTVCNSVLGNVRIDTRIPDIVATIIKVIQIAVPIVLVIFGMLDLFKSITASKEDEIQKSRGVFVKRLISAALVFFVIAIVKVIISFAAGKDTDNIMPCVNCFLHGSGDDSCVK